MKWLSLFLITALLVVGMAACDQIERSDPVTPSLGEVPPPVFQLSSDPREAVVLEARYALRPQIWGPYKSLHGNAVSEWKYLTSDMHAYNRVEDWYGRQFASTWGIFWSDPHRYACYGGYGRGGQCVYFTNLILFRSSMYQKELPSYETCRRDFESRSPRFTKSARRLRPGDILRTKRGKPNHTAIAVEVLGGRIGSSVNSVDVIDSNFIGNEVIGMHALKTSNTGLADLDNYFAVDLYRLRTR